jgi:Fic family protein
LTAEQFEALQAVIGLRPLFPYLTAQQATAKLGLSAPTVNQALERLGVVEEITGRRRGRVYCYRAYMGILGEDKN